jgi:hypothetical protein
MTDYEFAKQFQDEFDRRMAALHDENFIVDPAQQQKLLAIVLQFYRLTKEIGGRIDDYELIPRMQHGGVTATFPIVDLSGKSVRDFCNALAEASAISMDAADDGVCISVTVPYVFIEKQ